MKTSNGLRPFRLARNKAFTLVEIMIVIAIIALLASIAIPYYVTYRASAQSKACIANMKQIEAAKEQWALENRKHTGDPCDPSELFGSTNFIKATVTCPAGGGESYAIGNIGDRPTCPTGLSTHILP